MNHTRRMMTCRSPTADPRRRCQMDAERSWLQKPLFISTYCIFQQEQRGGDSLTETHSCYDGRRTSKSPRPGCYYLLARWKEPVWKNDGVISRPQFPQMSALACFSPLSRGSWREEAPPNTDLIINAHNETRGHGSVLHTWRPSEGPTHKTQHKLWICTRPA